jgi:outer membrane receptor protein involved in Fe transport
VSSDPTIFAVDSRNVVNARISYVSDRHHLQVSLFATNLLGENYIVARARDFLGAGVIKRGDPKSIGLQAKYDF